MKKWYLSKTLWLNTIGVAITVTQAIQGQSWINPEIQLFILAILNALLRLVTNTAIAGTPSSKSK